MIPYRPRLKPSETARAIRRLYELHGITEKGGRPTKETPTPGVGVMPEKTAEDVARDAGVSPTKARTLNRLADLIPTLMERLDAGTTEGTSGPTQTARPPQGACARELWSRASWPRHFFPRSRLAPLPRGVYAASRGVCPSKHGLTMGFVASALGGLLQNRSVRAVWGTVSPVGAGARRVGKEG